VSNNFMQERQLLADLHNQLFEAGLVVWSGGNISQRVEGGFLIKPSGLMYSQLTPESMVYCDLDGKVLEGNHSPSSDTAAHAYVYKNMPEVGGMVHTHSNYACAFAAVKKPIPCILTATADEFGGEIPVGPFAEIGDDSIGRGIVKTLDGHRSKAVLMAQHGVFTIGSDAKSALKAAVMCEDAAKSSFLAIQLANTLGMQFARPKKLPARVIDRLFNRYQNVYGQ
jgi:L-ribulose-5-phosphate 4-epimerase